MKSSIIDPANENVEYKADIDISDLIQLEEVISNHFQESLNKFVKSIFLLILP